MGSLKPISVALTAGVFSLVAFAGCSSVTPVASTPLPTEIGTPAAPSPSHKPTPEPEAVPVAPPVMIPPCEDLVSASEVHARFGELFQHFPGESFADSYMSTAIGPAAQAAITQSSQMLYCSWGIPQSDGGTSILVADIPKQAKEEFLSALRDSDFVESQSPDVSSFVWESDAQLGPRYIWYAFADSVLVASLALTPDGSLGETVVSSLQRANE